MKTVLAHGVFDLLHAGHVAHLRNARDMGDRLFVSILSDRYAAVTKRRPIYPEKERIDLITALRYVDGAILCDAPGPQEILAALRPDLYVRGSVYEGKRMPESDLLEKLGIQVFYTPPCPPHTTDIIARIKAL